MKRNLIIYLLAICSLCACHDNSGLYGLLNDYDYRIAMLEQKCDKLNTNIAALQTIIDALQTRDYITSVTPITSGGDEIGYTITFGNHESITIYNGRNGVDGKDGKDGEDGVDGQNGKNGQDGHTPVIGVAKDDEGNYYWTLDGEPLVDGNGKNLTVTGNDGVNGQDGTNGITPVLKIEADYWWISYDNGTTWTQLGKATGDKGDEGDKGDKGDKGDDGDSVFQTIVEDENFVYFTLVSGDVFTIRKYISDETQIVDGAIMAEFSVSDTKKVYFSMGGLQFSENGTHQCADGTTKAGTWRFAPNQWEDLSNPDWIYKFTWGSSGANIPFNESSDISMTDTYRYLDWGVYNAISNGGNTPDMWRTLSLSEWNYLFERGGGSMWLNAKVYLDMSNFINCVIFFRTIMLQLVLTIQKRN